MVLSKGEGGGEEASLEREDVLKIVDQALAVEEVIRRGEEVPVESRSVSTHLTGT